MSEGQQKNNEHDELKQQKINFEYIYEKIMLL